MRYCIKCSVSKDDTEFYVDKRNNSWKNNICKNCNTVRTVSYNRKYKKRYNWKRRGWSEDQIKIAEKELVDKPFCAICGSNFKLAVDHCHRSNIFRGILCHKCNRALGFFSDSPELLRKAADYLELTRTLH